MLLYYNKYADPHYWIFDNPLIRNKKIYSFTISSIDGEKINKHPEPSSEWGYEYFKMILKKKVL